MRFVTYYLSLFCSLKYYLTSAVPFFGYPACMMVASLECACLFQFAKEVFMPS